MNGEGKNSRKYNQQTENKSRDAVLSKGLYLPDGYKDIESFHVYVRLLILH